MQFSQIGRNERRKIADKVDGLAVDPGSQGKPLMGELKGYRSIKAAGRYRIVFQVNDVESGDSHVLIVAVGIRKEGDKNDVYVVASQLAKRGELLD